MEGRRLDRCLADASPRPAAAYLGRYGWIPAVPGLPRRSSAGGCDWLGGHPETYQVPPSTVCPWFMSARLAAQPMASFPIDETRGCACHTTDGDSTSRAEDVYYIPPRKRRCHVDRTMPFYIGPPPAQSGHLEIPLSFFCFPF